jgi:nucleoid-associated protein YgaU
MINRFEDNELTKRKRPETHIVEKGETLESISLRYYGTPNYFMEVAKANSITNFRKLKTGEELILPPLKKDE